MSKKRPPPIGKHDNRNAQRLRRYKDRTDRSIETMADQLGVSKSYLSMMMRGILRPRPGSAVRRGIEASAIVTMRIRLPERDWDR